MRTIVLLAYEGAQLLDITGPASVFAEAAEYVDPAPHDVVVASRDGGAVRTSSGVALWTVRLADVPCTKIDTVLVPGALRPGLQSLVRDVVQRDWVLSAAAHARRVGSVCSGAFVLAAWGMLDGRRVATHWQGTDELARRYPTVTVERDALFVEDGPIWTSAGVSTGIDMALALVERDLGRRVAASVARRLVLHARRPGHQSQFSALLEAQAGPYAGLVEWMGENLAADLSVDALAARAGQTPRTFHRRFTAALGTTPAAYVERLRLDRARALLEVGETPKRVAMLSGLGSLDRLGRAFRREFGLSPSTYRSLHGQPTRERDSLTQQE
ncbi:MAG TPA: DJ-1/PfpI family protein [Azospirillaceae bacterium]|nr:DJ-1/PfpI family protein [Azospirillaceae bacterium]